MFIFADFSQWIGKKIPHEEARSLRQLLGKLVPENADYFEQEAFKGGIINDDKDLSLYLLLKAKVVTIPGQDFGTAPEQGMLRFSLGDIGKMTQYQQPEKPADFKRYLPGELNLKGKPMDDLRKLQYAMDKVMSSLQHLDGIKQPEAKRAR